MSERRRPFRRGRRSRPSGHQPHTPFAESSGDADPYLDMDSSTPTPLPPADAAQLPDARDNMTSPAIPTAPNTPAPSADNNADAGAPPVSNGSENTGAQSQQQSQYNPQSMAGQQGGGGGGGERGQGQQQRDGHRDNRHNGRRGRNQRGRRQRGGGGGGQGKAQGQQQGGGQPGEQRAPLAPEGPDGETKSWVQPPPLGGVSSPAFFRRPARA